MPGHGNFIFGVPVHLCNICVTFEYQGHWDKFKVMAAKKLRGGMPLIDRQSCLSYVFAAICLSLCVDTWLVVTLCNTVLD